MTKTFEEVQTYAKQIKDSFGDRDDLYDEMDKIYLLDTGDLPSATWIKQTLSPDPRNAIQGAVRLLTATDPKWAVPRDKNNSQITEEQAGEIEKAAAMIWNGSSRIKRQPAHYIAALMALLYGQVDIAVYNLLEAGKQSSGQKARIERAAKKSPILFEVLGTKVCYPVYDEFGLAVHYTAREISILDVISRIADTEAKFTGKDKTTLTEFHEYWDFEKHCVWCKDIDGALIDEPNPYGIIPIASAIIEGSDLFEEEYRRQPFLFTAHKSKVIERQNLMLTLMASNAFAIGANPQMVYTKNIGNAESIKPDYSVLGGMIEIQAGENLQPLSQKIVDPKFQELYTLFEQKGIESTIYRQTLGEPMGGNAPYSMVSLLSQSGRLPLVPYQRMLSSVITDAMQIAFDMLRTSGQSTVSVGGKQVGIELDFKEVPEDLEIEATLDIDLPQDKAQNARVALELTGGDRPLMSRERVRQDFLNIGQSKDEDKQIWTEIMAFEELNKRLEMGRAQMQMQIQQMQMQAQQQAQMGQMQGPPQGQPMGQPGQMPPEMMQQLMSQQGQPQMPQTGEMTGMPGAQAGLPLEGALPPQGQQGMGEPDLEQLAGMGGM